MLGEISLAITKAMLEVEIARLKSELENEDMSEEYYDKSDLLAQRYAEKISKEEMVENKWEHAVKGMAVDAEWSEEREKLPAIKYEPIRHPKLAGVEKDYLE
jgi:hypothetical protein